MHVAGAPSRDSKRENARSGAAVLPIPLSRRSWRVGAAVFVTAICIDGFAIRGLGAQTIHGRLIDDDTGQPIDVAEIALIRGDDVARRTMTDVAGEFVLASIAAGRYRLRAERIGYESVTSPSFDINGDNIWAMELRASAVAVPLAPLTILSSTEALGRNKLKLVGYYERKRTWGRDGLGMGHFLDSSDLQKRPSTRVSDLLRDIPGVHIEGAGGRSQSITMRTVTNIYQRMCEPAIYLDGIMLRLDRGESIDFLVTARAVAAIEVYPAVNKPAEFGHMLDDPCGAVVLWTGPRD